MKTYLSRKNARIAAQKAGENMPDVSVHEVSAKNIRKFNLNEKEIGRFVYTVNPIGGLNRPLTPQEEANVQTFLKKFEPAPVSKYDKDEPDPDEVPTDEQITAALVDQGDIPPVNTLTANLDKSSIPSPVKVVHDIANNMPGARRKDVIAACVAQGVALNTARTQYQVWFRNQRKVG
jgi:hypothetical protein